MKATKLDIDEAIRRNVDLIGVDIILEGGQLLINGEDSSNPEEKLSIDDILTNTDFQSSNILLAVEIKEDDTAHTDLDDPEALAENLLTKLVEHTVFMTHGRPVLFRTFVDNPDDRMPYLSKIHEMLLRKYPMLEPHARFSATFFNFWEDPKVSKVKDLKAKYSFLDMIEIYYDTPTTYSDDFKIKKFINVVHKQDIAVALCYVPTSGWDPDQIQNADLLIMDLDENVDNVTPLRAAISSSD